MHVDPPNDRELWLVVHSAELEKCEYRYSIDLFFRSSRKVVPGILKEGCSWEHKIEFTCTRNLSDNKG